ncbi:sirohydrochlorin chelatase [Alkalihalobacillus macyae]|uniref:sirohydrochlorin chelatase n=1 Tax=Guptibacillus hwajinpoensis TaxID=208199 RepID=UPI00273BC0B1|nr:sirohydrochlorin chelatase [Alkalihalobacillus macyae]MDP4550280.1 sirohydrochlorin chelatase [Alkalihalobacillus macyae]
MQAVLYICHGSRVKEGRDQAVAFVEKCKSDIPYPIQETCFLEFAEPTIQQGIELCIQKGATNIAIIPVLLLAATHAKKDIPKEVEVAQTKFPGVVFQIGRPLGVHEKLIAVISDRVRNTGIMVKAESTALLVGRGSSDPDIKRDMEQIAEMIKLKLPFKKVSVCFLAAANPTFEEGLEYAKTTNSQVFVIPYLLFTGILMGEMEEEIKKLNQIHQEFVLTDYLGYHADLKEVLRERIIEATGIKA